MIDNVITAIDRVAAEHPTRVAYDYEGTQYTYAQLKEGSDRLAGFFAESLPAGEPIIVYGGQPFDMVEVFLGLNQGMPTFRSTRIVQMNGLPRCKMLPPRLL